MSGSTLVTGATGFVGSRLVRALLDRERTVRGFAHHAPGAGEAGLDFRCGDLLDPDAVEQAVAGCDTVFHCAAVIPGRGTEAHTWAVNVDGTGNLVAACVRHRVRRLVYVSTDSVYGGGQTLDAAEDAPIQTAYYKEGNYPQSKLEGEYLVQRAAAEHGLDIVILRPCMIYGPGPSPATELFAEWLNTSMKILIGGGASRLSVLYVDDLVEALLLAERAAPASGQTFNISDGQVYAKREIVNQLVGLRGRPRVVLPVPGGPLRMALAMLQPLARVLGPTRAEALDVRRVMFAVQDHTISCRKAIDMLAYAPKVLLREGLGRTVAWLDDHPDGRDHAAA